MKVARSSFYDRPVPGRSDDAALVARMQVIQDEFPAYGYRRITAQLRADGVLVNHKRVARLMRLHGMRVRPRRRYVTTTDSNHGGPIFPNLAKDLTVDGPDQLWVSDITFVAIATGFVYLAVILDAPPRPPGRVPCRDRIIRLLADDGRAGWSVTPSAARWRPG